MHQFSIQDIAQLSGIKAHTLRIWEQRYGIIVPQRTDTNIRWYDNEDLKKILNIALLNEHGLKISKLSAMSLAEIEQAVLKISTDEGPEKQYLHQLLAYTSEMNVYEFESALAAVIKERGMRFAVEKVIFPLMEKIGMLWLTNRLFASQEHLISNIIRQKLIKAIDEIPTETKKAVKGLLFLPEGEFHELGLLYAHYLFKTKKIAAISLGANLPIYDLTLITDSVEPAFVFTHITAMGTQFDANDFLKELRVCVPKPTIVISGNVVSHIERAPENTVVIRSIQQFVEFISTL